MSKDVKTQEQKTAKNNKKYIILAFVVILGAIGIMFGNGNKEETTAAPVATTEQAPVTEQVPVAKEKPAETEPTVARIDFTTPLVNADEPQFEVYVDGAEEPLQQTSWMPKHNKQGYSIQRLGNEMNIVFKALNNNEIKLVLRGPDKRDENNNIMESWVDYTSLTIDGKEILSGKTAVWHNKPFNYIINGKTDEEHKIYVRWQKHNEE